MQTAVKKKVQKNKKVFFLPYSSLNSVIRDPTHVYINLERGDARNCAKTGRYPSSAEILQLYTSTEFRSAGERNYYCMKVTEEDGFSSTVVYQCNVLFFRIIGRAFLFLLPFLFLLMLRFRYLQYIYMHLN